MNEVPFIAVAGYPGRDISFGVKASHTRHVVTEDDGCTIDATYVMQDGLTYTVASLQAQGCTVFGLSIVPLP